MVWGLGAHVIKTGLGPVVIDLMERGFVSALATNGASIIHDFEVAIAGATSEDVDEALGPGRFGMADETGRLLNGAINDGVAAGLGIGQAVARVSRVEAAAVREAERARRRRTAEHSGDRARRHRHRHHPHAPGGVGRGARRGQPARLPLLRLQRRSTRARRVPELRIRGRSSGGLPESGRHRAATAALALAELTTVNLDFIRSYRPQTNVVARPTAGTGRGYSLVGHHELMIPLLAAALVEQDAAK